MPLGNKIILAAVGLALLTTAVPPASANHGFHSAIAAQIGTCVISAQGEYSSGNFDQQEWSFNFRNVGCPGPVTMDSCLGFGSIEIGFTTITCGSGATFSIGPTNVPVVCCDPTSLYGYVVTVSYGGFSGQGYEIVTDF